MRLEAYEVKSIRDVIYNMDPKAKVYLFGSRVDDTKKGGDIDLLIISEGLDKIDGWTIKDEICDRIGQQKIDIIITKDTEEPFVRIALREGVLL
ncbi:MAG TPA: nucleotidyltransferase domain-containing protein [Epulopiscium sp.]|nr:nucleotidyltransferase domain-containing protein [Candidatus Epulonipiscium sp.]